MNKPTKWEYIAYLIDTKGYTEEEARKIVSLYGVRKLKEV